MTKIKVVFRECRDGSVRVELEPLLQYGSTKEKRACAAILIKLTDAIKLLEGKEADNTLFSDSKLVQDLGIAHNDEEEVEIIAKNGFK
jgi:hypothetical protein